MTTLIDFITESNLIEGIDRDPTTHEIEAHEAFLAFSVIQIADLENLLMVLQPGAHLREQPGMNVRVGRHIPPPGGLAVRYALSELLERANSGEVTPFHLHCLFETQHPFLDGNGRGGRALWLWAMGGIEGISRTFLPEFYKQAHGLYPQTSDFHVLRQAYYRVLDASRDGP